MTTILSSRFVTPCKKEKILPFGTALASPSKKKKERKNQKEEMKMLQVLNHHDHTWSIFNPVTGDVATVVRFMDTWSERGFYYRVDYHGQTQKTMLNHYATAIAEAKKLVRSGKK